MRLSRIAGTAIALLGISLLAHASDYRLAGTLELANGNFLAIIELPGGTQQIYHVGDPFEDGLVVRITRSAAHIRLSDRDFSVVLEGADIDRATEIPEGPVVANLVLNDKQLQFVMGLEGNNEEQLTADFAANLGLPEGLKVNHVRAARNEFASFAAALSSIQGALSREEVPKLSFESGSGIDAVYLTHQSKYRADGSLEGAD